MLKTATYINREKTHPLSQVCILTVVFMLLVFAASASGASLLTISAREANALILKEKSNTDFVILDIRTPTEFNQGHIQGAILIDFYAKDFLKKMNLLNKQKTYLIYCRSGNRSGKTLNLIKNLGFESMYNMGQGIIGWKKNGYTLVK